ncbi:MAG: chorismate-binding protein [Pseudodesulfovibrio sp.]|nr:chorismate-binding protein [Pseudodesulfovibrio sp.]
MLSTISISADQSRFVAFAGYLAREKGADLLLSSSGYPAKTPSVAGVHPMAELIIEKDTTPDEIKKFCFGTPALTMGFVSYSYGMKLRGVASNKASDFPMGHLKKYEATAEYHPTTNQVVFTSENNPLITELTERLAALSDAAPKMKLHGLPHAPPAASLNHAEYKAGVRETLERIRSGHTYQLNLSTRFTWNCPNLDPLALFFDMRNNHPAPFYAWLNSGSSRILSTSPERFLRVTDGHVLSQPIKGTLKFDKYTPELASLLTESLKESAELSMIVDLIRNDISANCTYGSVFVENHKSVFAVDTLLQMYADVHGDLKKDRDCLDLFFDAFPGGSVTGCPKQNSMSIIEELEPHSRDVYCGSVVVIRDTMNMDSSIAIRTAAYDISTGSLDYWAGSGIVVDSNPASEYQETLAKAEKFLTLGGQ